jgi:hypothetical protein
LARQLTPNELALSIRAKNDAFGRLRVSSPYRLFDSKSILDNQPNLWDDVQVSGIATSTHSINRASVTLAVTNTSVGRRVRQSKFKIPYQPGKSQQIMLTAIPKQRVDGAIKRIGFFDDNNGLFFQQDGSGISIVIRSSVSGAPVDTVIRQDNWNIEKLNGRHYQDIIFDETKANIFAIDFEWLGVGIVRFGIVIDGILRYVHAVKNANALDSVYMSTPNLPVRYELISTSPVNASLECICAVVNSEGGNEIAGWPYVADRGASGFATLNDAAIYPILSIRLKAARQSARILLENVSLLCDTNAAFYWGLFLNPTVVGTALTFSDVNPRSSVEAAVGTTNATTITVGANTVKLLGGYDNANLNTPATALIRQIDFILGSTYAGVSDILCLGVIRLSTQAETFYGAINYREII